jgi:general L-amino acid transport system substrate-binding protein
MLVNGMTIAQSDLYQRLTRHWLWGINGDMVGNKQFLGALLALTGALVLGSSASAGTLDTVRARGHLLCGVSEGTPGFSIPDEKGNWAGLDVDICRAVAAAIFNDPKKVTFRPLSSKDRFTAIQSGEVDLLARNTTFTIGRNTALGLDFPAISYYDGQGFMVRKSLNVKSVSELSGATICVESGTTTELNVADYFRTHNLKYELLAFQRVDESIQAYDAGRCDAYSTDHSSLSAQRLKLKKPDDTVILADIISKEPLAPAVRSGDFQWSNIVRWTIYALLNAEELGISQKNLDEMKTSKNPEIRRLLGVDADLGQAMGLPPDWAYRIIKHIGNYGETFDRNVGKNSPLAIRRGLNALWKDGGVQYAPPIR